MVRVQRPSAHPPPEEDTLIATTTSRGREPRTGRGRFVASRQGRVPDARPPHADPTPADGERYRIRLFDARQADHHVEFADAIRRRPNGNQLLWVDITGTPTPSELDAMGDGFDLDERTREFLRATDDRPWLTLKGEAFLLRLAADPDDRDPDRADRLAIVAGANLVITRHDEPLEFMAEMDERIERDTAIGKLDAPLFVASLLDSTVTTYYRAIDAIEDDADELDAVALRDQGRTELLADLVAVRRRIAKLRRLLSAHRDVFASLATVDIDAVTGGADAAPAFQGVAARFEGALAAVDDAREAILGSFDIYMTRTAQRTNDVMKVLALVTVLLLPGSLIAGLLGMNVTVPLDKDDPMSFWIVLAGVAVLAVSVVGFARSRRWL